MVTSTQTSTSLMVGPTASNPSQPPSPRSSAQAGSSAEGSEVEGVFSAHRNNWRQHSLHQQLVATRDELAAMKRLIEELPEIFERSFALRMEPLVAHRERLLHEIQQLRHDLVQLQHERQPLSLPMMEPPQSRRPRLARALQHAFGLARTG
jgi:hypothetical protein